MITCYITYEIDPDKLAEFEAYAAVWIALVGKYGGTHHGYLMPHESASDLAVSIFSFPSMADYEKYRTASFEDKECQLAFEFASSTQCIRRYDRQFLRPLLEGDASAIEKFNSQKQRC